MISNNPFWNKPLVERMIDKGWDGARIHLHMSPIVREWYRDDKRTAIADNRYYEQLHIQLDYDKGN